MTESRKIVKVFLASPGDLADERRAAKSAIDEINALYSEQFGYQVELVGWEDTVSVYGRPQAIINKELERCELFVGMMWKRWGTPPDLAGRYTSGFEEEFDSSVRRRLKDGRPEISLFFKEIDPSFLGDPGADLKKVLAFKEKLVAEKTILFESFSDISELEKKIRRCVSRYVLGLRSRETDENLVLNQAPTSGGEKEPTAKATNSLPETPLSAEGARFLRGFVSKTERNLDEEPIEAVEVARFRLLSSIVGKQGNDERSLGVHDTNLLFAYRSELSFGRAEVSGLAASGLERFSDGTTPVWHWFAKLNGFAEGLLPVYSILGPTRRRVGALAAMKLISEALPLNDGDIYRSSWFREDAESAVKVAAAAYLAVCGGLEDLPLLKKEFDRSNYQTSSAAADAIIRINLRQSRERAVLALYDLQSTSIAPAVITTLFAKPNALGTDLLMGGLSHRNATVRRVVVTLLRARHALPKEAEEQLLADDDPSVRYEGLKAAIEAGQNISDEQAKKVLIRKLTGLALAFLAGGSETEGDAWWSQFRNERLRSLNDRELEVAAAEDPIFDRDAQFILAERHFNARAGELRKAVDDQYKEAFAAWYQNMVTKFGRVDFVDKTRSLEEHIRKELTRQGLDVIYTKGGAGDLPRVRSALESGFVDYSSAAIEYLRQFGEWQDIPLIIQALQRPDYGSAHSLLSSSNPEKNRIGARAIFSLGQNRLSELVGVVPAPLLSYVVAEASTKAFRSLTDITIRWLLRSEHEDVRKAAAVKCVRVLPKRRVAKLLEEYVSGDEYRYYNVVHWLDFGVSVPRDRAVVAAKQVLSDGWLN